MNWNTYEQLEAGAPIYTQFARDPDRFMFVSQPVRAQRIWESFIP